MLCAGVLGLVKNEVMSSWSVNSGPFFGRLRPSQRLTNTKRGRPRQQLTRQLPLEFNSRNYNISVMFSHLLKDRTLEMEDR